VKENLKVPVITLNEIKLIIFDCVDLGELQRIFICQIIGELEQDGSLTKLLLNLEKGECWFFPCGRAH